MGKRRGEYRVVVGKPQVKRSLGRRKHRWEENIKMFLQERERLDLALDRDKWWALANTVRNLRVPESTGNFLTSWGTVVSFSRTTLFQYLLYFVVLYCIVLRKGDSTLSTAARLWSGRSEFQSRRMKAIFSLFQNAQTGSGAHPTS